jgi:4-diphosphocytidyl-2-C-methyl-D-erythritol kinase
LAISSRDAYGYWDQDGVTGPEPDALLEAMRGGDLDLAGTLLMNDLEAPVRSRVPDVAEVRRQILDAGALGAVMSGSGPTVAGLARDAAQAEQLARAVGGIAAASMGPR